MAKRPSKSRPNTKDTRGDWTDRFHRIDLDTRLRNELADWSSGAPKPIEIGLWELLDSGFSVKVTPPGAQPDYYCTATDRRPGSDTLDHTFSVSYATGEGALLVMYWVCTAILMTDRGDEILKPKADDWLNLA